MEEQQIDLILQGLRDLHQKFSQSQDGKTKYQFNNEKD